MKMYYSFSYEERDAFWNYFPSNGPQDLVGHFILISSECITPTVMGNIYKLLCGMTKEEQRGMLSLAYHAKSWRENRQY